MLNIWCQRPRESDFHKHFASFSSSYSVCQSVISQDASTGFTATELTSCLMFLTGMLNKDFTTLPICFPLDNWVTEHILYIFTTQHWRLFSLSFPSTLPPSIPFLLLNTAPSQPMESQTTAVRQWPFCKYHGYTSAW